jgi:hypothetical protein
LLEFAIIKKVIRDASSAMPTCVEQLRGFPQTMWPVTQIVSDYSRFARPFGMVSVVIRIAAKIPQ